MKKMLAIALFAVAASCMAQEASVRIDINGIAEKNQLTPVKSDGGVGIDNAGWMGPNTPYYLAVLGGKVDSNWNAYEFSFIPEKDGKVVLSLMGPWYVAKDAKDNSPVWVAYDNLTVTGAELKNPDFENLNDQGLVSDWDSAAANIVKDKGDAQSGKTYVKAWHNQPVRQTLDVKKGQKVTVKFNIKAVEDKK